MLCRNIVLYMYIKQSVSGPRVKKLMLPMMTNSVMHAGDEMHFLFQVGVYVTCHVAPVHSR